MRVFLESMGIKRFAFWLAVIGTVSLVLGLLIGVITFDPTEILAQIE